MVDCKGSVWNRLLEASSRGRWEGETENIREKWKAQMSRRQDQMERLYSETCIRRNLNKAELE
jgi:hypothetical protein